MKKIIVLVWIVFAVAFILFFINYVSNEAMISKYNSGVYEKNRFAVVSFTEPCIKPYNDGNICYMEGDYEAAIELYKEALSHNPSEEKDCKIRINLALAMLATIDFENIDDTNVEEIIAYLEEARGILTENGCASPEGHDGHNEDSQKLKEEIDAIIEQLKNPSGSGSTEPNNEKPDDNKNNKEREEKRKQIEEIENQGTKERNQEVNESRYFSDYDYIYYDGPTW